MKVLEVYFYKLRKINYSLIEESAVEETLPLVLVDTPKEDSSKNEALYVYDPNGTLFNKLTYIISTFCGYMFQRVFVYIIDFIQDMLVSKQAFFLRKEHKHTDCSTQTNFLNHISIDLKRNKLKPVDNDKYDKLKSNKSEKIYMQISTQTSTEPLPEQPNQNVSPKPEVNFPLPIPSDFKYSSAPVSLSPPQPPPAPLPPPVNGHSRSISPPTPPKPPSPKRSPSPDSESDVDSPPRRKSPSPQPVKSEINKPSLPRSHIALRDKDFALSLANVRLRKLNDMNKMPTNDEPNSQPKIPMPPGVPPPPPPPPPFPIGGVPGISIPPPPPPPLPGMPGMPPPPPPLPGMPGMPPPPPPPPPMSASLLAQILNPNAHFPRSSSVPPEQQPVKEEEIELELNDHRKLIYDLIPKPSRQLKICNWQKLPRTTIYNLKSVWREVNNRQDEISLDYSQLEELFVKTTKVIHRRSSVSCATNDQISGLGDDIRNYGKVS